MMLVHEAHDIFREVGHVLGEEVAQVTQVVLLVEHDVARELFKGPACVLHGG